MATGDDLYARYQALVTRRKSYEGKLYGCAKFVRPIRNTFSPTDTSESLMLETDVVDSTAQDANTRLGSRMTGTICAQQIKWVNLGVRDQSVNNDDEVRAWFEAATEQMLLAYGQSQFYAEINEALADLPGIGTGGIFTDPLPPTRKERFRGIHFRSVGVGEIAIDEGPNGTVDEVWREFKLSAGAAKAKWPKGLSDKTMTLAAEKPWEPIAFVHGVFPRPGGQGMSFEKTAGKWALVPVAAKNLPYASIYMEKVGKHVISEGGFHENPYAIGRWSRPAGDLFGWGIGHTALPHILTLNEMVNEFLKSWPMAVQPPFITRQNNVVGRAKLTPGGMTQVRDLNAIREWQTKANFSVADAGIEKWQQALKEMWFDDQLSLRESSRMTTVEVYARLELMQQLLGPNVGRIMFEVFNKNIERVFGVLLRAGMFPPMPEILMEYFSQNGEWDIEYQSPLARAARSPELQAIDRTVSAIGTLVTVKPDVVDVIKVDEAVRHIAKVAGVPATLMRTDPELADIRAQRAQQQAQMAQMQQAAVYAKAMGDASGMVKALQPQGGNGQ